MAQNNKIYSDAQERAIANYLGWSQVSGSGARPTRTGDVQSDAWLGECKTHIRPGHKIQFYFSVWRKIVDEASAQFKQPAYFVDDGSQKTSATWVMFSDRLFVSDVSVVPYPEKITDRGVSFKLGQIADFDSVMYRIPLKPAAVLIAPLHTFLEKVVE